MKELNADILENEILETTPKLLSILLKDQTTQKNIFWATNNYAARGDGYQFADYITIEAITGDNGNIIVPRALKSRLLQQRRSKEMAEVFTPSWVCNKQINLIDNTWFDRENVFNTEIDIEEREHSWNPTESKIIFPECKTWRDYVSENRLEITCGEAPYIVSRYDTVTGLPIPVKMRIGMLDRKLRIVGENTDTPDQWMEMALVALRSSYGYEWQGDNLLLARENLLFSVMDYYQEKFCEDFPTQYLDVVADIISWNIWQMDGLKGVVPCSCHEEKIVQYSIVGESKVIVKPCPGCKNKNIKQHNGIVCNIMDWEEGHPIQFISLIKKHN